ncbi:hypothetical protein C8R44DRAFT_922601 [Mycena epipterygia]|nr:hypothetical protein C8R44DRAFT_922601 [Mycena epipterygia]
MSIPYLLNPPLQQRRRRGKKPVIYFSPEIINVSVKLSLVPAWSFSSVYPIVLETVQWNIRTRMDGNLTEVDTGMKVSYLFWEADVIHGQDTLRSSEPESDDLDERFNPASCHLSDVNAVLLPTSKATSYLNGILEILGPHTEARTSFITFWLPSFLCHAYITLRFLPQSAYTQAVPLSVDPEPDVVTRVFMIFTGVVEEDRSKWRSADLRAQELRRINDKQLFRVLEWGGMEI